MTISEIASGQLIAVYRYFWTAGEPIDYCPKSRAGSLNVPAVARYVLGTYRSQSEKALLESYVPIRATAP